VAKSGKATRGRMQNVEWRMQKGGSRPRPTSRRRQNAACRSGAEVTQSRPQARNKTSAGQAIGKRSLVFLLCCSCAPLVLRWGSPSRRGGSTEPLLCLDRTGSAVIQTGLHFHVNLLAHAVPRLCQGQRQSVAQVSSPAGFGGVPAPRVEVSSSETPGQLAGEGACATSSTGLRDSSGRSSAPPPRRVATPPGTPDSSGRRESGTGAAG
jgi:hypothetical protein